MGIGAKKYIFFVKQLTSQMNSNLEQNPKGSRLSVSIY